MHFWPNWRYKSRITMSYLLPVISDLSSCIWGISSGLPMQATVLMCRSESCPALFVAASRRATGLDIK
jgi:hypothetical protein